MDIRAIGANRKPGLVWARRGAGQRKTRVAPYLAAVLGDEDHRLTPSTIGDNREPLLFVAGQSELLKHCAVQRHLPNHIVRIVERKD